jgi:hypothetical protein
MSRFGMSAKEPFPTPALRRPLLGWTKDGVKTAEQRARLQALRAAAYRPIPTREQDPWFKGSLHLKASQESKSSR